MADRPTLASSTELAILLDLPAADASLLLALRRASDAFAGAVGHPVLQVVDDSVTLRARGAQELLLPARPVTAATVQLPGVEAPEIADENPGAPLVLDRRLGILTRHAGWPESLVRVTYTHGYPPAEIPGDIQDVVLERAVHVAQSLGVYRTTGPITVTDAASGGVTQRWSETVDRYRVGIGDRS